MGKSMDDTPVAGGKQRWDMYVEKWEWDDKGGFRSARLFGDVTMEYIHSMETKNGKFYPEFCHGWDVDNQVFYTDRENRCPCCASNIKGSHRYYMNAIDLEAEENKPSRPKPDWSPIRFIDISSSLFSRLKELKTLNKGCSISDTEHGANVQIKFNPNTDPGSMYSASMDTKDVPITEEQKAYIVTQKYPNGNTKQLRGKDGLPAQFEYIRCVNSRDDMVKSLRRNGYYDDNENAAAAAHTYDKPSDETVARAEAETVVEVMDIDLSAGIFSGDSIKPPVNVTPAKEKSNEPHEDCPTEFGNFASALCCFSGCDVAKACRAASSNVTEPTTTTTAKKKEVAPVDDDDDSV
jgi:hypothetical protein